MTSFIFWMLVASALGFIKLLALAYFMSADEYGHYVTYFGFATFSSLIITLGITEKTIKEYPRRWMHESRKLLLGDAIRISLILTARFTIVAMFIIIARFFTAVQIDIEVVVWTSLLGLCAAYLALAGSMFRAAGSQTALQKFTLVRYLSTICIALPAGWLLGWQGAICGEVIGNLISIFYAMRVLKCLYSSEIYCEDLNQETLEGDNGHYKIYLANLAVAPQTMLDRGWVASAAGPALAGAYSLVMLIPQVAQLLSNIIVQHVGPLLIKLTHLKQISSSRQDSVGFNAVLIIASSLALTLSAFAAKHLPFSNYLFEKYAISNLSIFIVGIIACGQIYGLIEFHLIAHNREQDVLMASVISSVIFAASFACASILQADVEWFLAGIAAARWGQIWLLKKAYLRYA